MLFGGYLPDEPGKRRLSVETLIVAIGAFIGTNIDDIFMDTLLFSETRTKGEMYSVVIGKYVGMAMLTSVSLLAAWGLSLIPQQYIRYLGLIPIILGVKAFIDGIRRDKEDEGKEASKSANLLMNAALITVANGADNLGVYIPLFAGSGLWEMVKVICVFAVMVVVWCFFAKKLSELPLLRRFIDRYRKVIIPIVYCLLGIYMLFQ